MSSAEEDIQASAALTKLKPKLLAGDTAHYLRSRRIIEVRGDLSGLADIAVGAPPGPDERGRFVSLVDETNCLEADLCIAVYGDGALIDVHADLVDHVAARLANLPGVSDVDRAAAERWRVFGELPNQNAVDSGYETIRFKDGRRRELGARVFRHASEPEGLDWRHGRKWDTHAMKLGLLPDHRCVLGKGIKPEEAGYHRLLGRKDNATTPEVERRVLPVRIEPRSAKLPVMAGAALYADGVEIGLMLDQESLYGVALIFVGPWRAAIDKGVTITCCDEPALITWPTWLSSESEGRCGPAGIDRMYPI